MYICKVFAVTRDNITYHFKFSDYLIMLIRGQCLLFVDILILLVNVERAGLNICKHVFHPFTLKKDS